ncbi:hypothetical protein G6O69_15225 [Pseudenhygromyxa sp. WMMC2535]|uniref:hypothetical protein n=1 Tax=Pseudenhygromyxa sp. WMMC2535 TaxID=2712867 RepID=UPI00159600B2|nr:hypothetical protein [Pseudenhygromyxa sp. WMMC2535]NVB39193.1 hypothetical protein [Pseudenhygromyxa sp. WMMC2535]
MPRQRVFAVDVMTCPRCRGAMMLVEIANGREAMSLLAGLTGYRGSRRSAAWRWPAGTSSEESKWC